MKYYAVKIGKQPGIYTSWDECKKQLTKDTYCRYKSFEDLEEAEIFVYGKILHPKITPSTLIAYVDGSNIKNEKYAYGCVLINNNEVIEKLNGCSNDEMRDMRNVAGEITGAMTAVNYALKTNKYNKIIIYYDYKGIEMWAKGFWNANTIHTQAYQKFMKDAAKKIKIQFVKVAAHTGVKYNEMADELAKEALGIKIKKKKGEMKE